MDVTFPKVALPSFTVIHKAETTLDGCNESLIVNGLTRKDVRSCGRASLKSIFYIALGTTQ